jgi:hypothetical protein
MTQAKVVAGSRDKAFSSVLWGFTPAIGAAYWKWIAFLETGEEPAAVTAARPPCTVPIRSARRTTRRLSMTSRGCPRRTPGFSVERCSVPVSPRR